MGGAGWAMQLLPPPTSSHLLPLYPRARLLALPGTALPSKEMQELCELDAPPKPTVLVPQSKGCGIGLSKCRLSKCRLSKCRLSKYRSLAHAVDK
jgi:hypothetical protein